MTERLYTEPPALNLPDVVLDSIRVLLTNTPGQVCKHWAALTLLDQLERAGVAPDVVLVKALCAADSVASLTRLAELAATAEPYQPTELEQLRQRAKTLEEVLVVIGDAITPIITKL